MTQRPGTGVMHFIRWYTPIQYQNLKLLTGEYKKAKLLFQKLQREEGLMDDKEEMTLLKAILESLMKQLPVAITEVQQAEGVERRLHHNLESLSNIVNVFKRDILKEVNENKSYIRGLVQGNQSKINSLGTDNQKLLNKVNELSGQFGIFETEIKTRIDTLIKVGDLLGGLISLAIAALALMK
ncbi:hypothetical protein BI308_02570 [Roseofilum reptotaenium AO1-A]|uniref:Uncharacterized protein n=1 Tax=Roseofilum reptotaenium AO1-A TaxID=1925591 RepID=A0A1L9QXG0_9CYAN|nr:hypothetical protein [Roseofilum reptotaenium]OJJ27380.1 hypothetical protein BI308_02570 [Roseofilum reptotaenium AO1-A]